MVGLIGGTFDPIHFGHIHLAVMLSEIHNLEEVWFIPSLQNPLKKENEVDFKHRYQMVKLGIEGVPKCKALPIEAERPPPSYTIDTVKELKRRYPNKNFYLLLGDDHLSSLNEWKDIKELLEICPPLVGTRSKTEEVNPLIKSGITRIPLLEISSTLLRHRLENNLYCGHLIPTPVLDYIQQNGLYYLPYD